MSAHNPYFQEEHIPRAYFITFRCYGTWLHGDGRGSTDRDHNRYGTPFLAPSERWQRYNEAALKHPPVKLDSAMRAAAEAAIRETCEIRRWALQAINVRTNHLHAVVSAPCQPEPVLSAFKANATRKMREAGCWRESHSPWSDKGSRRYLWTPRSVERAIDYTHHGQGDEIPDFNAEDEQ
jgi:REP element-mobilizing transposase RayT